LVQQETNRQAQIAIDHGVQCLVFDVPLLLESKNWRQRVDQVLVVDCLPETQIKRTMKRSHLSREQVQAIMASQTSRDARLQAADVVVFNDTLSLAELADQVRALADRFGLSSG
jgi:dephospho-CoA kinase